MTGTVDPSTFHEWVASGTYVEPATTRSSSTILVEAPAT